MSEKVLGFKEKDAVTFTAEDQKEPTYSIWEKQLVPVVSLQALEKWFNDNPPCQTWEEPSCKDCEYDLACTLIEKMLSWAKKEAKKNG